MFLLDIDSTEHMVHQKVTKLFYLHLLGRLYLINHQLCDWIFKKGKLFPNKKFNSSVSFFLLRKLTTDMTKRFRKHIAWPSGLPKIEKNVEFLFVYPYYGFQPHTPSRFLKCNASKGSNLAGLEAGMEASYVGSRITIYPLIFYSQYQGTVQV